jgi:hypothetical protein
MAPRIAQITVSKVLELLVEETAETAGLRGHEERDLLLGRLFGLSACARYSLAGGGVRPALGGAAAAQVLRLLLELFAKRKWMREACAAAANDLLCSVDAAAALDHLLPLLAPLLSDADPAAYSADLLSLALAASAALRRAAAASATATIKAAAASATATIKAAAASATATIKAAAAKAALLFPEHLRPAGSGGLCALLRPAAAAALTEPLKHASGAFPRLHLCFHLLLDACCQGQGQGGEGGEGEPTCTAEGAAALTSLWTGGAGAALLNGSHQMKGTALALLPELAKRLGPDHVAQVERSVAKGGIKRGGGLI